MPRRASTQWVDDSATDKISGRSGNCEQQPGTSAENLPDRDFSWKQSDAQFFSQWQRVCIEVPTLFSTQEYELPGTRALSSCRNNCLLHRGFVWTRFKTRESSYEVFKTIAATALFAGTAIAQDATNAGGAKVPCQVLRIS